MSHVLNHRTIKENSAIGGKAKNLLKLSLMGFEVPSWVVITQDVLLDQLPKEKEMAHEHLQNVIVPSEILTGLEEFFGANYQSLTYAVRSSAIDEDGSLHSFAGQFESYLHVPYDELSEKIKAVWCSVDSDRVKKYRIENGLPAQFGIAVLIQEMIEPDIAGVAFGINPVTGDSNSKVISSVYGLGEGLVSGELDADTFTLNQGIVKTKLAVKNRALKWDPDKGGIKSVSIEAEEQNKATLDQEKLNEISAVLDKLKEELGEPQDIEFAYSNDHLYLLQTRPITTPIQQQQGEYILWDNSNIIESYPGITTPLTYSFITKMYEFVYRQFVGLMGVNEQEINQHSEIFANTLGLVRGRVYYNLLNWYKMLAMLPGYSINAGFMEKMMGVKESFDLQDEFQMSKGLARVRLFFMILRMIYMHGKLGRDRRKFQANLNHVISLYKSIDFNSLTPGEIISKYITFEQSLLLKWKAPLVNDFFAMIWFGVLQKLTLKYSNNHPNLHNDLLSGSQDIISVEPVHKTFEIVEMVKENGLAEDLFRKHSPIEIWDKLKTGYLPEIKSAVDSYLDQFGERCVGELKLETVSYSQDPSLFIKIVKSYLEQQVDLRTGSHSEVNDLSIKAESIIYKSLKGKPIRKLLFNYVLKKTRELVSSRENLRYERTRGFGMVRTMFAALGKQWQALGYLENHQDLFYLSLSEIKSMENSDFDPELKTTINQRKQEFDEYRSQDPPQERFFTYGHNFSDNYIFSTEKLESKKDYLSGIGCCPGIVQAKVKVVQSASDVDSLNGDILVTSSTDPGWITLFPTASAIIVERGSLLSHSAIVSREMGIPCIVSVKGLLRSLTSGDEVLMDGSTGEIKVIR